MPTECHSADADKAPSGAPTDQGAIVPVAALGASAGGLEALIAFFASAPTDSGAAFVVIQHLDPDHESLMTEILGRHTAMTVRHAEDGMPLEADSVTLIPPNASMTLSHGRLRLDPLSQPRGVRRPIDEFFLSTTDDPDRGLACVVLSGTGSDGSRALRAVKEAGGLTLVQEPAEAKFDGMPQSAVATTFVDDVLPAADLPHRITAYFRNRDNATPSGAKIEGLLPRINDRVFEVTGHRFHHYKPGTLVRRVARRMFVTGAERPSHYERRIADDPAEVRALFSEMLINVTGFFRDPEVFAALREKVAPRLVAEADPVHGLRIWSLGCSSGEEAYTLAMIFNHEIEKAGRPVPLQVFGTDIDARMLDVARNASYPVAAARDVPEPYRSRYLIAREADVIVAPPIRDVVRFAHHSILRDPPFSRLDMISCRNLLIYLDSAAQRRVLPMFHFALREGGALVLGSSEGINENSNRFAEVDRPARIFRRKQGTGRMPAPDGYGPPRTAEDEPAGRRDPAFADAERHLDAASDRILSAHAPAYMAVGPDRAILRSSGRLTRYLEVPDGAVTTDAVALARPSLREPMRRVIAEAFGQERRVALPDVEVASELGIQTIDLIAEPLPDGTLLVVFRDVAELRPGGEALLGESSADHGDPGRVELEGELRDVRTRLRTTVEELEAANEELRSSNEEMMSMNEELQSANEELITVNEELKSKVDEVAERNADLRHLLASNDIATVFLDGDLCVRLFTPRARQIYPLRDGDIGRALADMRSRLDYDDLMDRAADVLQSGAPYERRVSCDGGAAFYTLNILAYEGPSGTLEGVVLTFADVTEVTQANARLVTQNERLDLALAAAKLGIWEFRPPTGALVMDPTTRVLLDLPAEGDVPLETAMCAVAGDDRDRVEDAFAGAIESVGAYDAVFSVRHGDGEMRVMHGVGRAYAGADGRTERITGAIRDITETARAREQERLLLRELNHRVKNTVAVIGGIVRSSSRHAADIETFAADTESRINALSASHTLLVDSGWTGMSLPRLVEATLDVFDLDGRIEVDVADRRVPPLEAQALALVLHELAINSLRHGALSSAEGRVRLILKMVAPREGQDRMCLCWTEYGGPEVAEPRRTGFGTSLLRDMVAQQHNGEANFDWQPTGLSFKLELDAENV